MLYLVLKVIHIFSILLWVSGMIMQAVVIIVDGKLSGPAMPRELARLRLVRKWEKVITTPAMICTFVSGLYIALTLNFFGSGWLFAKITIVMMLAAVHGVQAGWMRRMLSSEEAGGYGKNMLPVILVAPLIIIFLVLLKPF